MKNFNVNQADFNSGFNAGVTKATDTEQTTLNQLLHQFILNDEVLKTLATQEFKLDKLSKADQASFIKGFITGFVEQGTK